MNTRTIMVANTKTQQRHELNTSATTLGELKADMRQAGIDYSGMTFTEGISKTQLISDDSLLPTNVMYKGAPTNNLVMLLTNTTKNIASGCGDVEERSRKKAYDIISNWGQKAKDDIKVVFGKNYTQVKTSDLWKYIDEECDEQDEQDEAPETENEEPSEKEEEVEVNTPNQDLVNCICLALRYMFKTGKLNAEDLGAIAGNLDVIREENKFAVSDSDIDEMLANIL